MKKQKPAEKDQDAARTLAALHCGRMSESKIRDAALAAGEAAARILGARRCKQAGMHWRKATRVATHRKVL